MKIVKADVLKFLNRVNLKGLVNEVVIEADGSVATSFEKEMLIAGKGDVFKDLGKRIGITNLSLLIKILDSLETADNNLNLEVHGNELILASRSGKYQYRLADPDVITSVKDAVPEFVEAKKKGMTIELPLTELSNIRKAVSVFDAKQISLFVEDGMLQAIVSDDATKSNSVVELASGKKFPKGLKLSYRASTLTKVLNMIDAEKAKLTFGEGMPLFIDLPDGSFMYAISNLTGQEEKSSEGEVKA